MTPAFPAAAASAVEDNLDPLRRALERMAVVSANSRVEFRAMDGGVSSDIYRVDVDDRTLCVKRALPKLKVAADWQAPIERSRYEVEWMRVAAGIVPASVPAILGEDAESGAFAMAFLPPERYPVWKAQLRDGTIDATTALAVGDVLGRIHAGTADRPDLAARFATDAIFFPIRLEPYLVATGRAHPDLAARMAELVEVTRTNQHVLVHGDFSPKNILIGPQGPVVLDAECAWYGDPAFDLAFVLNHLLLKGVWKPQWRAHYVTLFAILTVAYRDRVTWEPWAEVETRTAALLPALLLARVDGKSPVEYVTTSADRGAIRAFARQYLAQPTRSLAAIANAWTTTGSE